MDNQPMEDIEFNVVFKQEPTTMDAMKFCEIVQNKLEAFLDFMNNTPKEQLQSMICNKWKQTLGTRIANAFENNILDSKLMLHQLKQPLDFEGEVDVNNIGVLDMQQILTKIGKKCVIMGDNVYEVPISQITTNESVIQYCGFDPNYFIYDHVTSTIIKKATTQPIVVDDEIEHDIYEIKRKVRMALEKKHNGKSQDYWVCSTNRFNFIKGKLGGFVPKDLEFVTCNNDQDCLLMLSKKQFDEFKSFSSSSIRKMEYYANRILKLIYYLANSNTYFFAHPDTMKCMGIWGKTKENVGEFVLFPCALVESNDYRDSKKLILELTKKVTNNANTQFRKTETYGYFMEIQKNAEDDRLHLKNIIRLKNGNNVPPPPLNPKKRPKKVNDVIEIEEKPKKNLKNIKPLPKTNEFEKLEALAAQTMENTNNAILEMEDELARMAGKVVMHDHKKDIPMAEEYSLEPKILAERIAQQLNDDSDDSNTVSSDDDDANFPLLDITRGAFGYPIFNSNVMGCSMTEFFGGNVSFNTMCIMHLGEKEFQKSKESIYSYFDAHFIDVREHLYTNKASYNIEECDNIMELYMNNLSYTDYISGVFLEKLEEWKKN